MTGELGLFFIFIQKSPTKKIAPDHLDKFDEILRAPNSFAVKEPRKMTLLLASIQNDCIWMISDSAITGGTLDLRERLYAPKIEVIRQCSLLGFAGDHYYGQQLIREAAKFEPGYPTLEFLAKSRAANPSVDFAYAFRSKDRPHLFRIGQAGVEELTTLFIGDAHAFSMYQSIRHDASMDHAPDALHTLLVGVKEKMEHDNGLVEAISAMLRLFATSGDPSVGGWVVPCLLTPMDAYICSYAYSVTDPIIGQIAPGQTVPHGTAEAGGYSLSFSELEERDGIAVYWLQRNSGKIYVRNGTGYDAHSISGTPSEFCKEVSSRLNRRAHVWFGEGPMENAHSVAFINDGEGRPRIAFAQDDKNFSMSWLQNTEGSFEALQTITMTSSETLGPVREDGEGSITKISISDDGHSAVIGIDGLEGEYSVDADGLDAMLQELQAARAKVAPAVGSEIAPGTKLLAVVDPAWHTRPRPHQTIAGPMLCIRHPGFGWLSFILPDKEARKLGKWLVDNSDVAPE